MRSCRISGSVHGGVNYSLFAVCPKKQRVNSLWKDIEIYIEERSASKIRREDPYLGAFASKFAVKGSARKFVV